ncbi:MAG: hypothetical protein JOZ07_14925 [Solirubrobacterales bacterium]|nr:hypothetical protein [Solirubrobacterales bacterium]
MAPCTVLDWDHEFPFDRYDELNDRAGDHKQLPEGCLARVVGGVESGAQIIEVWEFNEHAKRFSERNTPLIDELRIPPPSRVSAVEATIFQARHTNQSDRPTRRPPPTIGIGPLSLI